MKKILLFSRDPGGANTIIPLVEPLQNKGYNVKLFGKDVALDKYKIAKLQSINIMDYVDSVEYEVIEQFLVSEKPDFIFTGTSADDFTEKYIWKASQKLGIPSFAILDQWMNYGLRFSNYGVAELNQYNMDKVHPYLPYKICVMDEIAKNEAVKDGLEAEKIVITGQPYFETLTKKMHSINQMKIKKSEDFVITFASEPITETYKEDKNSEHYWGYTEKIIFNDFIESLNEAIKLYNGKIVLILKLHPKENPGKFDYLLQTFNNDKITLKIDKNSDSHEVMTSSDLICGMSSMFLIESAIINKPVISIQIGLKRENPFILDKIGILKSILTKEELVKNLKSIVIANKPSGYNFSIIKNPVENIINEMERLLCQS